MGFSAAFARWFSAIQPSVSRDAPYAWKYRCAVCASVWAAEIAPNGCIQFVTRPPSGWIRPARTSSP